MHAVVDRPSQEAKVVQIVQVLRALPAEKVTEVWDFVAFLQDRYAETRPVDDSYAWSDQDLHDLRRASLAYAESTLWAGLNMPSVFRTFLATMPATVFTLIGRLSDRD